MPARILSFSDTDGDSTIFRYSVGQFFGTRTDSPFSRYSPGFNHFAVLKLILPFFGTRPSSFFVLAWILPFLGTRPNSIIFRYSKLFDPFLVIAGTVFRYSHGFYLFLVLARILRFFDTQSDLPFSATHTDSIIFRYSPEKFFGTRTGFTFSRYSPGFYHFSVLTLIRPFSCTRPNSFSILARILPFPGTRPDSTIFRYSH